MRDVLPDLERWLASKKPVALATVVETWGSSPRRPGAHLALTADGEFSGSVSGGCVENAVIEAGLHLLKHGGPRLLRFGVSDQAAWEVGLACGGRLEVFVRQLDPGFFQSLRKLLADEAAAVMVTAIRGAPELVGRALLVDSQGVKCGGLTPALDRAVKRLVDAIGPDEDTRRLMLDDSVEVLVQTIAAPPTLVMVGGVHISVALAALARTLGFRTVLVEPRPAWGGDERFDHVDQLIRLWPQQAFEQFPAKPSTAIAVLTHDPKLDDPALIAALNSPAFYVGALGSRTTQTARRARLLESGLDESQLARLHGPIGLDIGAETPEEIALAILTEIVAVRRGLAQPRVPEPAGRAR